MKNTRTIKIKGGLGNQLFQYAYGLKSSLIDKKDVVFDTSFFKDMGTDTNRPFLLSKFNISLVNNFKVVVESKFEKIFNKIIQKITGEYGYYQSDKYFKEIKENIQKEFTLKNPLSVSAQNLLNNIQLQTNSVSLHIRRGDYVENAAASKHHGICSLDYYYEAEKYIKNKIDHPMFFVFSDDIDWVKNNLKINNCIYISNPDLTECEELTLMSKCSHNIIANSTFSWWAAYLNQNNAKIIIAPKQWTVKKTSKQLDILPKDWIQM